MLCLKRHLPVEANHQSNIISVGNDCKCRFIGKEGGLFLQQTQTVAHHQQARAHVGEHGHPHGGVAREGQHQKHRFDAQGKGDALFEGARCGL